MSSKAALIGRSQEQLILENCLNSNKGEFLTIYGRRRIGKTYLVRTFYKQKSCVFLNANGIKKANLKRQLNEFIREISHVFYGDAVLQVPKNWFDAFEQLKNAMNQKAFKTKKIVLFFDEFPWMATPRSKLLEALDFYWNRHFSIDSRIKLIICGSSSSWIIKNIINSKGGLHNRLTQIIQLEPLSLHDTKAFLAANKVRLNHQHVTELYMATGGVPYYLSHVKAGLTSAQIIHELAFSKNSFFLNEFDNLYAALFDKADTYIELMRIIAKNRYGISQENLFNIKNAYFSKGGTFVNKLKDLESAGFIISFTPHKHEKKGKFYRVIDEYTLFYFSWIEPIKAALRLKGLREGYWQSMQQSPHWHNWAGYAFEAICFKHLNQISIALKLSPASLPSSWRYSPQKRTDAEGAQIDLLFERDDNAITLCEIKFTEKPFYIDKAYAAILRKKMDLFRKITRINTQYFLVMISAHGLKKSIYSEEMVDAVVTLEDLFVMD